jgi:hypothetical protein
VFQDSGWWQATLVLSFVTAQKIVEAFSFATKKFLKDHLIPYLFFLQMKTLDAQEN